MTFKEISAWIEAVAIVLLYGFYVVNAPAAASPGDVLRLYVEVAVAFVMLVVALNIAAAMIHRPEKADERDKLIAAMASRNGSFVLMTGVTAAIFLLLGTGDLLRPLTGISSVLIATHVLVLTAAASELLRFGSQIVYYRRGA